MPEEVKNLSKVFYQVNSVQTEKLYKKAMEYAGLTGEETVIDAYCGIGTIGIVASDKAKEVIGVELNKDAVRDAVTNAKLNNIKNISFYNNDAGKFMVGLASQEKAVDVVFMDSVKKLGAEWVVYISCGAEALVRDLEYFCGKGNGGGKGLYWVENMEMVDMFPIRGMLRWWY